MLKYNHRKNPKGAVAILTTKGNIKEKTKVSGCFRSIEGAKEYLKIMSYVSTAIKHGFTGFDAIRRAVIGNSMSIFAQGL